ncbi:hypothetical protein FO440_12765 [Mucilaginibacter corticis]|uniref:Uncharacterized protein n=1 Tax=Mucilaginibacter corticis TaxID=2597670 RepID=A0A556ML07_9SPHI|nr:hypothetical protein [Mucilaginibacter corticis]TSJ40616.1 hypothetical protein FO440_12765 [Mucilaginibacter corticis]
MKKILLAFIFLFIVETNFALPKRRDEYQSYLYSLNMVSKLFSKLTDNADLIVHRSDRESFKTMAVSFNKKVGILIVNQNNLISLINRDGFKDHHFPNTYRIMQDDVSGLKKILLDNRPLVNNLRIPAFNAEDIYSNLNFRIYENDELLRQVAQNRRRKAFRHKVIDNLTQAVVLLNECRGKVAALYSKIK